MKKIIKKIPDYYLIFCIYALIGWIYEVFWMWFVVPPYHFTNRGVLFGPFLPIYGFGLLILLFMLDKFMKKKHKINNNIYLVISSLTVVTFIYTTIIEYTTPKIYHVGEYLSKYGIGLLIINILVLILLNLILKNTKSKKIKNIDLTIILVFLLIWIITTSIEYVSHFMTDKLFNTMLWDYSKDFLYTTPKIYHVGEYLSKYGIGLLITNLLVLILLNLILKNTKSKKIKNIDLTIILVFLLIWIITTSIEYVSHFMTDKLFNTMLWDYSKDFLNINKRVNWDASRNFAIGGTFLLYVVQPQIDKLLKKLSQNKKITIALIIGIPMAIDLIINVLMKYL